MTTPFPHGPTFWGQNEPSRVEADVFDLEVTAGTLPPDLNGTWYRVGADHQFPPFLGDDVFINGDGMMSMFRFENGHVDLKTRYVHTERFKAERAARRSLYGLYRNGYTDHPAVAGKGRGTANTAMVWHGGRLLALKEDSRPIEIDPETLATRGEWSWGGKLRSKTMTAHPKIDPATGEMFFYGAEAEGDGSSPTAYCIADKHGNLMHEEWFEPPFVSFAHDFAVSSKYAVFLFFPATMDPERLKAGGPHWMWDGSKETIVGVMPRYGSAKGMRWFRRPAGYAFHVFNAFDEGDKLVVDMVLAGRIPFPFIEDIGGAPFERGNAIPMPTRWTFDMSRSGDTIEERPLVASFGEMPRIDERMQCQPYRYGYMVGMDFTFPFAKGPDGSPTFNFVGCMDTHDGSITKWNGGELAVEESVHATTPARPSPEDGYVLSVMADFAKNVSELMVLDARRIADGPIARIRVPFRMKMATHGTWVAAQG